jgi:hypothetical protein
MYISADKLHGSDDREGNFPDLSFKKRTSLCMAGFRIMPPQALARMVLG